MAQVTINVDEAVLRLVDDVARRVGLPRVRLYLPGPSSKRQPPACSPTCSKVAKTD
jgi:hypothetical protein